MLHLQSGLEAGAVDDNVRSVGRQGGAHPGGNFLRRGVAVGVERHVSAQLHGQVQVVALDVRDCHRVRAKRLHCHQRHQPCSWHHARLVRISVHADERT